MLTSDDGDDMWRKVGEAIIIGSLLVILLVAPAYALLFGGRSDIEDSQARIEKLERRVDVLEDMLYDRIYNQFDVPMRGSYEVNR